MNFHSWIECLYLSKDQTEKKLICIRVNTVITKVLIPTVFTPQVLLDNPFSFLSSERTDKRLSELYFLVLTVV